MTEQAHTDQQSGTRTHRHDSRSTPPARLLYAGRPTGFWLAFLGGYLRGVAGPGGFR